MKPKTATSIITLVLQEGNPNAVSHVLLAKADNIDGANAARKAKARTIPIYPLVSTEPFL